MAGAEPAAVAAEPVKRKVGRLVPTLVVVALMMAEGVLIYLLARSINPGPAAVAAMGSEGGASAPSEVFSVGVEGSEGGGPLGEVELAECRPINSVAGRLITLQVRVTALVDAAQVERARQLAATKRARIEDTVNFVIRSAEPKHLSEPGLETVKRRMRVELNRVLGGEELIREVLIPQLLQSGSGV